MTTKPDAPYREFWISFYKSIYDNPSDHDHYTVYTQEMPNKKTLHVIEHSAYAALEEKLRAAIEAIRNARQCLPDELARPCVFLDEALAKIKGEGE